MEVDEEIEGDLLRQFNCMNTSDKDALVGQFKSYVSNTTYLSDESAMFYLDMVDWNLQSAIGAYFDLQQSSETLPKMSFMKDITIGEGESITPNTCFVKTWMVRNSGQDIWPSGCSLVHTNGESFGASQIQPPLDIVLPGHHLNISVPMMSPSQQGHYASQWRIRTPSGHFFGDTIWVILDVADDGTLGLMQQMVNLGGSPPRAPPSSPSHNPFLSTSLPNSSPILPNFSPILMAPREPTPLPTPRSPTPDDQDVTMS